MSPLPRTCSATTSICALRASSISDAGASEDEAVPSSGTRIRRSDGGAATSGGTIRTGLRTEVATALAVVPSGRGSVGTPRAPTTRAATSSASPASTSLLDDLSGDDARPPAASADRSTVGPASVVT